MLDLALTSGRPPLSLLDSGLPDVWQALDLEILAQWKRMKEDKCPGCGRPVSQHLYNSTLDREEEPNDYMPYSIDCPAMQAIAEGQDMWKNAHKSSIENHNKGNGPDPGMGVYWLSQGHMESLPRSGKPKE